MADQRSSTEYLDHGEGRGGRRTTADQTGAASAAVADKRMNDRLERMERAAARLEKLASIDSDVRSRGDAGDGDETKPRRAQPATASAELTRANLRVRIGYGVIGTGAIALSIGGVNVFSYGRGLAQGEEERAEVIAETKAVRDQLDDHEARIAEVVQLQSTTAQRSAAELRMLSELQLLQWRYMGEVLEAIRRKRDMPPKPQVLIDAEARAFASLRDEK